MSSSLSITSTLRLSDGKCIPRFGLGVYLSKGASCTKAVQAALQSGYRHIDTAEFYGNEREVGSAVNSFISTSSSKVTREDIFVTSKVWDSNHGFDAATRSIDKSLKAAGVGYFDLFLIHSPNPGKAKRLDTYRALLAARDQGKIKSIGVSNYGVKHIEELLVAFPQEKDRPALNQIELSPFFQRGEIVKKCKEVGIAVEAYSPLGKGNHVDLPELKRIAERYQKTPAQILIRWSLQNGFVCIPKSSNPSRIKENADIFDFELSRADMQELDGMETGMGVTWDPTTAP